QVFRRAAACDQAVPERLFADAERADDSHAGDGYLSHQLPALIASTGPARAGSGTPSSSPCWVSRSIHRSKAAGSGGDPDAVAIRGTSSARLLSRASTRSRVSSSQVSRNRSPLRILTARTGCAGGGSVRSASAWTSSISVPGASRRVALVPAPS